jgi:hypothetical protein
VAFGWGMSSPASGPRQQSSIARPSREAAAPLEPAGPTTSVLSGRQAAVRRAGTVRFPSRRLMSPATLAERSRGGYAFSARVRGGPHERGPTQRRSNGLASLRISVCCMVATSVEARPNPVPVTDLVIAADAQGRGGSPATRRCRILTAVSPIARRRSLIRIQNARSVRSPAVRRIVRSHSPANEMRTAAAGRRGLPHDYAARAAQGLGEKQVPAITSNRQNPRLQVQRTCRSRS